MYVETNNSGMQNEFRIEKKLLMLDRIIKKNSSPHFISNKHSTLRLPSLPIYMKKQILTSFPFAKKFLDAKSCL